MDGVERTLWDRWRLRRDEGAFETLVTPHLRFAGAFARRLGLGPADADDVVQRSLVRLSAESSERPARVGMKAWLGREVLQGARMTVRAARRRETHEGRAPVRAPESPAPLEVNEEVERALATLDEKERRAVELRFLHDLEYREIAYVLETSALACRLRVHRALARLRQRLGPNASVRVAALPVAGLTGTWRSLAQGVAGGEVAAVTAVGGVVLMGASTKIAIAAVAAAVGIGVWAAWPEATPRERTTSTEVAQGLERAQLEGRGDRPASALSATPVPATAPERAASPSGPPLDTPIPPGRCSVSGRVTFADGEPARDMRVALSGSAKVEVVTDKEGRFHIHDEWVSDRTLHVAGPQRYELALSRIPLVADKRVEVEVKIARGGTLEGVLLEEATRKPVPENLVVLRRPGAGHGMQGAYGWVETDKRGRFRFDLLPPDAYTLEVHDLIDLEARAFPFEVRAELERREFLLRPARFVRMRLENVPMEAQAGALGWVWDSVGTRKDHLRPHGEEQLDGRGGMRVALPPPGVWTLRLEGHRALPELTQQVVVTEEGPEEIVVRVPNGASVGGILRDAAGAPLAGAAIQVGDQEKVVTDAAGEFTFPRVTAGPTLFYLRESGLSTLVGRADVPASGTARVELAVPGRGSIRFRVVHAGSVNYGVASLSHPQARTVLHSQAWPDDRGEYRFRHLAPGIHHLFVFAGSLPPHWADITLGLDEERDLGEIRFAEPVEVPVDLVVPVATKLPSTIPVWAGPVEQGGRIRTGLTGRIDVAADGSMLLRELAPGTYLIQVQLDGFEMKEQTIVEIRGPRPDRLRLELRAKP